MDIDTAIENITKNTLEVIEEDELREILKKDEKVAYVGFEPSGKIHLGHALTIKRMKALQDAGFTIKIFIADLHAYLNGKGTLEELAQTAQYNMKCFKALGLSEDTEFVMGSDRMTREYIFKVIEASKHVTIQRAQRSMAQISRDESHNVAETLYPLMQVIDIYDLGVDVAVGGMEQRKIHMLARELLPKLELDAPVCIHIPLIHGTDGSDKMSSSKGNFIAVDDDPKTISKKINESYCPMGQTEDNPVLELAHYYIYDEHEKMLIERPEKFGGNLELTEEELLDLYSKKELHPMDLKNTVTKYLTDKLESVRVYMEEN
ncbi:MAG: tyrosine--tRNA ligase [Methanosphaera sp.]|nr:tyrosine--tRNA ligase [Methanosphaera sp.]